MSLKAKIEAVIYAAEEPVTLAQLAAIFAAEVPAPEPTPIPELPQQIEAPLVEGESTDAEITTLDASGLMQDAAAGNDAWSTPRLEEESLDVAPAATDTAVALEATATEATLSEEEQEAAAKRASRQRERDVRDHLRTLIDELISDFVVQDRGIEIREIAGGYRMATKPEYHDAVRSFVKSLKPVMKLSPQALETLAVIAYKQPVTAPEVSEIRGVDSGGVLASLISRKLVTTAGRKQVIGRPILYKTTKEFLLRFGLKDLSELPSTEEFEKMAVELAESEALEESALEGTGGEHHQQGAEALPFEEGATVEDEVTSPSEESTEQNEVERPPQNEDADGKVDSKEEEAAPRDVDPEHELEPVAETKES